MAARVPARRGLMVSRVWLQVVGVVVLFGFPILGLLAHRTYVDEPSIPTQGEPRGCRPLGRGCSPVRRSVEGSRCFSATV